MHWLEELLLRKKKLGHMLGALVQEAWVDKPATIIGSDEVGYGSWAGPLVVCAVAAPFNWEIAGLKDSKELSELQRESLVVKLYDLYFGKSINYCLVEVSPARIDELGVGEALKRAHLRALEMASVMATTAWQCVVDGNVFPGHETIMNLPKADTFVPQVMAASIIAKHVRDSYMKDMAEKYPGYGFENHVGYGTPEHKKAIKELGPCALHRMSYSPFKEMKDDRGDSQSAGDVPETPRESGKKQRAASDCATDIRSQREPADQAGGKPERQDRRRKLGKG